MIQLIVDNEELTEISEEAKAWFYELVKQGDKGPFTCQTFNDQSKTIKLSIVEDHQIGLF